MTFFLKFLILFTFRLEGFTFGEEADICKCGLTLLSNPVSGFAL